MKIIFLSLLLCFTSFLGGCILDSRYFDSDSEAVDDTPITDLEEGLEQMEAEQD